MKVVLHFLRNVGSRTGEVLRERREFICEFDLAVSNLGPAHFGVFLLSQAEIPIDFVECSANDRYILHEVLEDRLTGREVPSISQTNLDHISGYSGSSWKTRGTQRSRKRNPNRQRQRLANGWS